MIKMTAAERVAKVLITALENGVCPWHCGWNKGYGRARSVGGHNYRGINFFLTNFLPYANRQFLTFKKCQELGGKVKKGEKSHEVTLWLPTEYEDKETGKKKKGLYLRVYNVFNVEQCEGLPEKFYEVKEIPHDTNAEGEKIINGYRDGGKSPRQWDFGGNEAFYDPMFDVLRVPKIGQFPKVEEFYATTFHEMAHSTGAKGRLNRWVIDENATPEERWEDRKSRQFGGKKYAFEELVAELTSAILMCEIGITSTLDNSAAYCESWAKKLGDMPASEIVKACGAAQKAADFIMGVEQKKGDEE